MAGKKQQQQLVGITGAAEIIGRSTDYVRQQINRGKLPAFRVDNRGAYSVKISDLNKMYQPVPVIGYDPQATVDLTAAA